MLKPLRVLRNIIAYGFVRMLKTIEETLNRVASSSASSAHSLALLASKVDSTLESMKDLSKSMNDLQAQSKKISQVIQQSATEAHQLAAFSKDGREIVVSSKTNATELQNQLRKSYDQLKALAEKIEKIANFSKLIHDVAQETKMLSFNASIEAARAGEHGKGFAIVSDEIGRLAATTSNQNVLITSTLQEILHEISPTLQSFDQCIGLVGKNSDHSAKAERAFSQMSQLSEETAGKMAEIKSSIESQNRVVQSVATEVEKVEDNCLKMNEATLQLKERMGSLSIMVSETYDHLGDLNTGSFFHQVLEETRRFSAEVSSVFHQALSKGSFALEQLLDPEYIEIRGQAIGSLARLFDISKVPSTGFTPPKYSTIYDSVVDERLQKVLDRYHARVPRSVFSLALDLNAYAPIHMTDFCKAWTGNYERDLIGNRAKRFFDDTAALLSGARVGLKSQGPKIPKRVRRSELIRQGCDLSESRAARQAYRVQSYARDTGEILMIISTPIFVKNQLYGAAVLAWKQD